MSQIDLRIHNKCHLFCNVLLIRSSIEKTTLTFEAMWLVRILNLIYGFIRYLQTTVLNPLHVLTLPYSLINIKSIRHILTCWFWFVVRQLVITVNYNIYKIYPTKCTSTGSYQLDVVYKCCRCVALLGNSDTFQPKLMFYAEDC